MKYSIGDKIEICDADYSEHPEDYLGASGTVIGIDPEYMFPYEIDFDFKHLNGLGEILWAESEIRLIKRDPKVIMESIKVSIKDGIEELLKQDYRKANIEIDLLHFIKGCLKEEEDYD